MSNSKLKIKIYDDIQSRDDNKSSYEKLDMKYEDWSHSILISRKELNKANIVFDKICDSSNIPVIVTLDDFRSALKIARISSKKSKTRYVTSRCGYFDEEFVTEYKTYSNKEKIDTRYLNYTGKQGSRKFSKASWEPFKNQLSVLCDDSDYMLFAVSCAFAGTVAAFSGGETDNPFFYIQGGTSTGKSTVLEIASYLLPNQKQLFVKNSSATSRGLEEVLAKANNQTAFFDELGKILKAKKPAEREDFVHFLSNGEGKIKSKDSYIQEMFPDAVWELHMIASGEDKLEEVIIDDKERGASARLIPIPINSDVGIFNNSKHSFEQRFQLLDDIKNVARKHDGFAWDNFVTRYVMKKDQYNKFLAKRREEFCNIYSVQNPLELRRLQKFALLAATGELLIATKLLDLEKGTALAAIGRLYEKYLDRNIAGENQSDILPLCHAILAQFKVKGRIVPNKNKLLKVDFLNNSKTYGFVREKKKTKLLLLKPSVMENLASICKISNLRETQKELVKQGVLNASEARMNLQRGFSDATGPQKDIPLTEIDLGKLVSFVKKATVTQDIEADFQY